MIAATPGVIGSLCFVDDHETARGHTLLPDEIEVKPLAYALDKTDVDTILGRTTGESSRMIGECAGIVTGLGSDVKHSFHVGDRVACWNTGSAFASRTRIKAPFVSKIPDLWPASMVAALPQNMSLAHYALCNTIQLSSGQTVLIHGAGGPLG